MLDVRIIKSKSWTLLVVVIVLGLSASWIALRHNLPQNSSSSRGQSPTTASPINWNHSSIQPISATPDTTQSGTNPQNAVSTTSAQPTNVNPGILCPAVLDDGGYSASCFFRCPPRSDIACIQPM